MFTISLLIEHFLFIFEYFKASFMLYYLSFKTLLISFLKSNILGRFLLFFTVGSRVVFIFLHI